jgi:hypothetical protein
MFCFVNKNLRFRLQEFRSFGGGPKSKLYSFVGGTLVLKFKFSLLPSVPSVRRLPDLSLIQRCPSRLLLLGIRGSFVSDQFHQRG